MAIYPVKMLKDEQGQPFVPLTHVNAVAGEEYTTTVLDAGLVGAGHYQIVNDDLTTTMLVNKVIAIKFETSSSHVAQNFLKINNESEYGIYKADGVNFAQMAELEGLTCFFTFTGTKFCLLLVAASSSSGGHGITDSDGTLMPQRSVLNFNGAEVVDVPAQGATSIRTGWISQKITLKTDTTATAVWQPMIASAITLPQAGTYNVHVFLQLTDITYVGKEFGVCLFKNNTNDGPKEWRYQYGRFKGYFHITDTFNAGDTITPNLYIDPLTSTSATTIQTAWMYIEYIPTKEVDL